MPTPLDVLVFYGSVRTARRGIGAARFVANCLSDRGHRSTLIDPKEVGLPLIDRMFKEYPPGEAPRLWSGSRRKFARPMPLWWSRASTTTASLRPSRT